MSTDRELLELAAKAAGMYTKHGLIGGDAMPFTVCENRFAQDFREWNPLTDDGDALRLAVRLGITVHTEWRSGFVAAGEVSTILTEGEDAVKATRRAIVIAAAAIGRAADTMKGLKP